MAHERKVKCPNCDHTFVPAPVQEQLAHKLKVERNIPLETIATTCGMTREAVCASLNGRRAWKPEEAEKLVQVFPGYTPEQLTNPA
jgi:plasmid maintenance system antidote protein VapI